jgi:hypothetical protein
LRREFWTNNESDEEPEYGIILQRNLGVNSAQARKMAITETGTKEKEKIE